MSEKGDTTGPILHVIVVGFHHKKGCQVEYSYPPLIPGNSVDSGNVPPEWKHLASLALPDGAHNFLSDTIYFHVPSRTEKDSTVYGISCYRQIDAKDLVNREADVTRNTVQKSVCVLSTLPLYGLIQAKLELITHAYFEEKDFRQVSLLEATYNTLNSSLTPKLLQSSQVFLGLSCRDTVHLFRHKIVMLFKLILLERKVLFFSSPVKDICVTIVSLLSLFPGMLENGLKESACVSSRKRLSPNFTPLSVGSDEEGYLEVRYTDTNSPIHDDAEDTKSPIHDITDTKSSNRDNGVTTSPNHDTEDTDTKNTKSVNHDNKTNTNTGAKSVRLDIGEMNKLNTDLQLNRFNTAATPSGVDGGVNTKVDEVITQQVQRSRNLSDPMERVTTPAGKIQRRTMSEGGLPDFGIATPQMEELLEHDECFSWDGAGALHLEIVDDEPVEHTDHVSIKQKQKQLHPIASNVNTSNNSIGLGREDVSPSPDIPGVHSPKRLHSVPESESGLVAGTQKDVWEERRGGHKGDTADVPSSPTHMKTGRAATIRNKLALAVHGRSHDTNLVELDDLSPPSPVSLDSDGQGFPLAVFTKGVVCHPYLALQYCDLLNDINIRGFLVGATNILFRQKRHLVDTIVELTPMKIEVNDLELQRQLTLSTADLRFADYLVQQVTDEQGNIRTDDTGWIGGDQWIRLQFHLYLLSLLATVQSGDEKLIEDFNGSFVATWKTTHNYKVWRSSTRPGMEQISPGHMFQGQLCMADMKLKLSQTMQSTERGKKINAAVSQTGKAVMQTGRAVGGAITSAKSAMSSWLTGFGRNWSQQEAEPKQDVVKKPSS